MRGIALKVVLVVIAVAVLSGVCAYTLFNAQTGTAARQAAAGSGVSDNELDEAGEETDNSSEAVKTAVDFEPPFDYEIYGGGIETLEDMSSEFYVSAIIAPTIAKENGGRIYNIRNQLLLQPRENVFKSGIGPAELFYTESQHTNLIRIQLSHDKNIQNKFQLELQYYV